MKQLLYAFFILAFRFVFSQDWKSIPVPANVSSFNSTNNQYITGYYGDVYSVYTYNNAGQPILEVEKFDQLNQSWVSIYTENLVQAPDTIKTDNLGGEVVFTFVAKQTPTPEIRVYQIVNDNVVTKVNTTCADIQPYSQYDFKMGPNTDEFYWFVHDVNGADKSLLVWDQGTSVFIRHAIPQLNGVFGMNLQLQELTDTLWLSLGSPYTDMRLFKTAKSSISFQTHDGSATGIYKNGTSNVDGSRMSLLSNRIDRITISGNDLSSAFFEHTFINGTKYITNNITDYFPYPVDMAKSYASDKIAVLGNFSPDGSNTELKVYEKTYSTDSWVVLGNTGNQIFRQNDYNLGLTSLSYSEYSNKYVMAYDSTGQYKRNVKLYNTPPHPDSVQLAVENYICKNSSNNFFSTISAWDENNDSLKIVSVTSGDVSILPDANIVFSTQSKSFKRTYFAISGTPINDGLVNLIIKVTDGFDTITFNKDITIAPFDITSTVDATICGGGAVTLDVVTPAGNVSWFDSGSSFLSSTAGQTSYSTSVGSTTTFYAQASVNGCTSPMRPVYAYVNPIPDNTILTSGPTTFCVGSNVTLTSNAPTASYSWSDGQTSQSIVVSNSGTYTLTVTENGCTNSSSPISVIVNSLPIVNAGVDQTTCVGDNVAFSASGALTYSWDHGITDGVNFQAVSSTTYTVIGTDANGCSNSDQVDLLVNALPVVDAGVDQSICIGNSVTLNGNGAVTYSWDNGVTDGVSFNPTITKAYVLTGTDANNCINKDTVNIMVNPLPTATISTSGSTIFCSGNSVTLTASPGVSYLWSDGSFGQTLIANTAGNYSVTVTDANNCQQTSNSVTVFVLALPSVQAGTDQTLCLGENVTLTATGASTYVWDNGITNGVSFSPTNTLTYTVTGTDGNGCSNTDQVDVTVLSLPIVDAGVDQTICQGVSVTLSGAGANSYSWNNGVINGSPFSPSVTSIYILTGTDANLCQNTDTVIVTVNSLPSVSITPSGATTFCAGGSVDLTATTAVDYLWSDGSIGQTLTVNTSGSYFVTVTDANSCQNTSAVEIVTVNPLPNVVAGNDTTICLNQTMVLFGNGASTYIWDNGITNGVSFSPTNTLTYTVTGTDSNGCSNTDQVDVTVLSLPVVDAGFDQTICQGVSVTLSGAGANSYSWNNGVIDGSPFSPYVTSSYVLTGTDANLCQNTDTVIVTVNSLPSVSITPSGATTFCAGGSVDLTSSAAVDYLWSDGSIGQTLTVNTSGSYFVTVTDANSCQNTSAVEVVTVNPLPNVFAGFDQNVCENSNITLAGSGAVSYTWDNGITDGVAFTISNSGTYTVIGTDGNGCQSTDQIDLTFVPLPTLTTNQAIEICQGEEISLDATSSSNFIFWHNIGTGGSPITAGDRYFSSEITNDTTLYVSAIENGCSTPRLPIQITVNPNPVVSLISGNSDCNANNGYATASISSGTSPFTYFWSNGEQQTLSINALAPGSYYIDIEDAKGCKTLGSIDVLPSTISIVPNINHPLCPTSADGSISIQVNGTSENLYYLWSNGNQTNSISNLSAGNYQVTVRTDSGCEFTSDFNLVQPSPITHTVNQLQPSCGNNDGSLSIIQTIGGSSPYSYVWSNGQFGAINSNITYGVYTLTTTDNNGCLKNDVYYVSESNAAGIVGSVIESSCGSSNGAIDVNISPQIGETVTSVSWSNGATTEDISNISAGNYICRATTSNSCVAIKGWNLNGQRPIKQEICIVTVDSASTTNIVVWEKAQTTGISHYNIYRETNVSDQYLLIDTVNFTNLSVFNDVIASPQARSWRYKISAVDHCGVESELSNPHKTLHLNLFDLGVNGVKITWDDYEGNPFSSYLVKRYTDEFGWEDVATLPITTFNYTDAVSMNTPGLDYMVEIILDEPCTATTWRAQDFNKSRSNKDRGVFNPGEGTGEYSNNSVFSVEGQEGTYTVYPNPFNEFITIDIAQITSVNVELVDLNGKVLLQKTMHPGQNQLGLNNLESGIYVLRFIENNETNMVKLIKN